MDACDRAAIRQKIAGVEEQLVSLARQKEEAEAEPKDRQERIRAGVSVCLMPLSVPVRVTGHMSGFSSTVRLRLGLPGKWAAF